MTWFLDPQTALGQASAPPLDTPIPSATEQVGLGFHAAQIENDSWAHHVTFENQLLDQMAQALGAKNRFDVKPATPDEWHKYRDHSGLMGYAVDSKNLILDRMAELQQFDPSAVGNLPVTANEFDAEVLKRRQGEYADTQKMLAAGHSGIAKTIGSFAGQAADETQIPFFFLGGGSGDVIRFLATEAGLGGVGAALTIPKQEKVASDLGTPAPNPVAQIATGAALGFGFGAVVKGIGHGLSYVRTRRATEGAATPGDMSALDLNGQTNAAETALRTGEPPAPFKPNPTVPAESDPAVLNITRLIGGAEAPRGFDQVYAGSVLKPPRPLTQMTVDQVLRWQEDNIAAGAKSSAAGRFQIVPGTLRDLKKTMNLSGAEIFDQGLQRRMAIELMREKGLDAWRAGRMSNEQFGNELASIWASLPDLSGPKAGVSHYEGDGLNHALVSTDDFLAALGGKDVATLPATGGDGFTGHAAGAIAAQTVRDLSTEMKDAARSGASDVPVLHDALAGIPDLAPAPEGVRMPFPSRGPDAATIDGLARDVAVAHPDLLSSVSLPPDAASAVPVDLTAALRRNALYQAAKEADPQTFRALEESQQRAATYRRWLHELGDQQAAEADHLVSQIDSRIAEIQTQLDTMKTGGRRVLRQQLKDLAQAKAEAEALPRQGETPDITRVRQALTKERERQYDLAPKIGRAYRASAAEAQRLLDAIPDHVATRAQGVLEPPLAPEAVSPASYDQGARSPAVARADAALEKDLTRAIEKPATREAKTPEAQAAEMGLAPDAEIPISGAEGGPTVTAREVLADLQKDQNLLDVLDVCRKGS